MKMFNLKSNKYFRFFFRSTNNGNFIPKKKKNVLCIPKQSWIYGLYYIFSLASKDEKKKKLSSCINKTVLRMLSLFSIVARTKDSTLTPEISLTSWEKNHPRHSFKRRHFTLVVRGDKFCPQWGEIWPPNLLREGFQRSVTPIISSRTASGDRFCSFTAVEGKRGEKIVIEAGRIYSPRGNLKPCCMHACGQQTRRVEKEEAAIMIKKES